MCSVGEASRQEWRRLTRWSGPGSTAASMGSPEARRVRTQASPTASLSVPRRTGGRALPALPVHRPTSDDDRPPHARRAYATLTAGGAAGNDPAPAAPAPADAAKQHSYSVRKNRKIDLWITRLFGSPDPSITSLTHPHAPGSPLPAAPFTVGSGTGRRRAGTDTAIRPPLDRPQAMTTLHQRRLGMAESPPIDAQMPSGSLR